MSKFTINLQDEPAKVQGNAPQTPNFSMSSSSNNYSPKKTKRRGLFGKILLILGGLLVLILLVGGIAGYFWWSSLVKSPAYSLAMLVDAARKDDQKAIDQYLDTDLVVDSFVPQITEKAVERYGRGLPPQIVSQVSARIAPFVPAVKDRARAEIPRVIREKAEIAPNVSPWILAMGLGRVVTITEKGDDATISGKIKEREIEVTMKRNGDKWKVVGVKDANLADKIAEKIGQELIAAAKGGNLKDIGKKIGVKGAEDILKDIGDILK